MPFTYMGTKKKIASDVSQVVAGAKKGTFLDLFAGISSVGTEIASSRQIWCNDSQAFAYTLAAAKFTSKDAPIFDQSILVQILDLSNTNRTKLLKLLGNGVLDEDIILSAPSLSRIRKLCADQIALCSSRKHQKLKTQHYGTPHESPYCLFSLAYVGGYFGARQAADIDSLKYSFDKLLSTKKINKDQHRWYSLALCKTLFSVANTTGHFAQYLDVKKSTLSRFVLKRRRDVFTEWATAINQLCPVGTTTWREKNKCFFSDANLLLGKLHKFKTPPSVIYADPPYTADQYSRYYHLLETLLLYDYPESTGKGQYRPGRFVSDFSLQSKVHSAFENLVSSASKLGVELIINYPEYGLLDSSKDTLLLLLRKHFAHAELAAVVPHIHSTHGASKGIESNSVNEMIFYAH